MSFVSTFTEFAMMDTRATSGALVLPLTTDIPGRIINIKDTYGAFTRSSLTVYTQGGEAFEDGTNFRVLNCAFDHMQVYTASTSRWYITGGTYQNFDTANVAVISTLQTYNWPSLCNHPNLGYGSTFNPPAIGEIALLDNIFTSSTAGLVSTFIEIGNLNAQPFGMSTGATFRWLFGAETDTATRGNGLQFKIKRWNSFGMCNSPLFYGANLSTLIETVNINYLGNVGINNSNPGTTLDVGGTARASFLSTVTMRTGSVFAQGNATSAYGQIQLLAENLGGDQLIAFHSTPNFVNSWPFVIGRSVSWTGVDRASFNIGVVSNTVLTPSLATTFTTAGNVGIGIPTPATKLDVAGTARATTMSTLDFYCSSIAMGGAVAGGTVGGRALFRIDVNGTARFSTVVIGMNVTTVSSFGGAVAGTFGVGLALTRGDAYKIAGTGWTNTSDQRIKENIVDANLDLCYENIKKIKLRRYNFISSVIETGDIFDKSVLGFVAQEVSPIIPKAVKEISFLGYDNLKTLNTDQINMASFGALQKTITDKEGLESTVLSLQTMNGTLVERISTLEGKFLNLN